MTPFFMPVASGFRFCIYHAPTQEELRRGGLVYVHPFAEEMNKSRRMAALQARRLAASGMGVLQIDLLGCGDSSGEFADARWELWKEDVLAGLAWLKDRVEGAIGLWGLRLGATLAVDIAQDPASQVERLILWQPVLSGEQYLRQFLRLHLAGEMLTGGAAKTGVTELRERLAAGNAVEVGGYELHPDLAGAIDRLTLAEMMPTAAAVQWHELSSQAEGRLAPASLRVVEAWRARGSQVKASTVNGDPFWSTMEITESPALLEATDAFLKAAWPE